MIFFIHLGNKSTVHSVLNLVAINKNNEYLVELEHIENARNTTIENYTLYEILTRDKEHGKYVIVVSQNDRVEKMAFVVYTPTLKFDEIGRIHNNPVLCPAVYVPK